METIHKFPLLIGKNRLHLPAGAQVLHVHEQHGKLMMWVKLNPVDAVLERRKFIVVATGEKFEDCKLNYIGTIHLTNLSNVFVFHVFEEI